jgi:Sigma-70 factor, region 1.2
MPFGVACCGKLCEVVCLSLGISSPLRPESLSKTDSPDCDGHLEFRDSTDYKEHEESGMTQPNQVIDQELELDNASDDGDNEPDIYGMDDEDDDEGDAIEPVEAGTKAKKGARKRVVPKKKHYTEDSIRLYLQEIGRIRLLRADEEKLRIY